MPLRSVLQNYVAAPDDAVQYDNRTATIFSISSSLRIRSSSMRKSLTRAKRRARALARARALTKKAVHLHRLLKKKAQQKGEALCISLCLGCGASSLAS